MARTGPPYDAGASVPSRPSRVALAMAAIAAFGAVPVAAQIPEEFTNLQVLPEDVSRQRLIGTMRNFSMSLGVRCWYCHVGEEGQSFAEYDFASDDKPTKLKARYMLGMTGRLNDELLAGLSEVADRADPPVRVRCVTCHRGVALPLQIGEIVSRTIDAEGLDAGLARYRELRETYYGSGSYDFGEQPLVELALGMREDPDAALALYDLALEFHPESVQALVGSAQVKQGQGDVDGAREALERALELAPDNPQIQRLLERLPGPA